MRVSKNSTAAGSSAASFPRAKEAASSGDSERASNDTGARGQSLRAQPIANRRSASRMAINASGFERSHLAPCGPGHYIPLCGRLHPRCRVGASAFCGDGATITASGADRIVAIPQYATTWVNAVRVTNCPPRATQRETRATGEATSPTSGLATLRLLVTSFSSLRPARDSRRRDSSSRQDRR